VHQDKCYPAARFNEKGCLQVWGGDALTLVVETQDFRDQCRTMTAISVMGQSLICKSIWGSGFESLSE